MRFGLILANQGYGAGAESLDAGAAAVERLGWHSVWVTDHLLVPAGPEAAEYGSMLEALTALTYVAARYARVRVGTSVIVPAMRDAPLLAKQLATLDVLSAGRLTVGVGVSDRGDATEYANLGKADRFAGRGAYLDEAVALWRHLWAGRTDPFAGTFHTLTDFCFDPLPVQGAAIPIWCGGRSVRALRRTAALADGYHAAQTGPADLADRLPRLAELVEAAGRKMPVLSVRTRVRFDQPAGAVYTLHGAAEEMVAELLRFARAGTEELVLAFDAVRPEEVAAQVERFHETVVEPFRAARHRG
jgi:probable F420-dependent oxidoreductase